MRKFLMQSAACAAPLLFVIGFSVEAAAAPPADWSSVPSETLNVFYPGQSTYDWLVSPDHPKGNNKVPDGADCLSCHEEDEEFMGEFVLDDSPLEPAPSDGAVPFFEVKVQAAYDSEKLYMRFQWESVANGDARVAVMFDDDKVDRFAKHGCWLTCHNGMPNTEGEAAADAVKANAAFSAMNADAVRKYLAVSRTGDHASWDKIKPAADIAAAKQGGKFLDLIYWQTENGTAKTGDGYILEYRHEDEGGSANDASGSHGVLEGGTYTVVLERKLDTGHPGDDKILKSGGVYNVGVAIHDGELDGRYHYTALPVTLGIGADGAITAAAQ